MKTMALILVLAAVVATVNSFLYQKNDIASAAMQHDWDEVHRILAERYYNFKPVSASAYARAVQPQYPQQYPQQYQQEQPPRYPNYQVTQERVGNGVLETIQGPGTLQTQYVSNDGKVATASASSVN